MLSQIILALSAITGLSYSVCLLYYFILHREYKAQLEIDNERTVTKEEE